MELRPKQPTTKGPADWFSGDVYVDAVAQGQGPSPLSVGSVHFTPCAHTAWHRHSIGQTLYVTEGEGRVQSRGGPVVTIRPGDVIRIAASEWHWHGAAPDHFMTHLAITEGDTEWGEHLSDAEYPGRAMTAGSATSLRDPRTRGAGAFAPAEKRTAVVKRESARRHRFSHRTDDSSSRRQCQHGCAPLASRPGWGHAVARRPRR